MLKPGSSWGASLRPGFATIALANAKESSPMVVSRRRAFHHDVKRRRARGGITPSAQGLFPVRCQHWWVPLRIVAAAVGWPRAYIAGRYQEGKPSESTTAIRLPMPPPLGRFRRVPSCTCSRSRLGPCIGELGHGIVCRGGAGKLYRGSAFQTAFQTRSAFFEQLKDHWLAIDPRVGAAFAAPRRGPGIRSASRTPPSKQCCAAALRRPRPAVGCSR